MSGLPDRYKFLLDGEEALGGSYDEAADVLYLWRGEKARPGVALSTPEGHLVRIDPITAELVGVTIFDWGRKWKDRGRIELRTPEIQETRSHMARRDYFLEAV